MNPRPIFMYSAARNSCFPFAMMNALIRSWQPWQIPGVVLKTIFQYSLDGRYGSGTSDEATMRVVDELNRLGSPGRSGSSFRCQARLLMGPEVTLADDGLIAQTLRSGGSAVVDVCSRHGTHSLTLLGIDAEAWTFFDSDMWDGRARRRLGIQWLGYPGNVWTANLRISREHLDRRAEVYYALGPIPERVAVTVMPG